MSLTLIPPSRPYNIMFLFIALYSMLRYLSSQQLFMKDTYCVFHRILAAILICFQTAFTLRSVGYCQRCPELYLPSMPCVPTPVSKDCKYLSDAIMRLDCAAKAPIYICKN